MLPAIDGLLLPNSGGRAPINLHHASRRRAGHKGDVGCHVDGLVDGHGGAGAEHQCLAIATSRIGGVLQQQSQVGLEDLAVAVLGEAFDELVVPRPLVARDVVEAEGVQVMG